MQGALPRGAAATLVSLLVAACAPVAGPLAAPDDTCPLRGFAAESRQVSFPAHDGVPLAGQLDLPDGAGPHPLVVILHHSGPVDRCAYDYMAQLLVANGLAVFRFDKRGTGRSAGEYGCCEADDAVAAWRAAAAQPDVDRERTFLLAQSLGTRIAADRLAELAAIRRPRGILLLSSLLRSNDLDRLPGPLLIVLSDSEPDLAAVGADAVRHARAAGGKVSLYIAEGTEHTLFDTTTGPVDWDDPAWRNRFHTGAARVIVEWLKEQAGLSALMPAGLTRVAPWRI